MLRLLLVDDEILVRVGLKNSIDWNKIGFEIVGEADNGQKALEIAGQTKPDLVLTDIRMPKLDGLALIKALKSQSPDTKVVVLSCYQDFEYVREAMQLGALDYIPKLSMQPEDLVTVMEKVKKLIEEEQNRHHHARELENQVNTNIYEMRQLFLNDLFSGAKTGNFPFGEQIKTLKLRLKESNFYAVLSFRIDDYHLVREKNAAREGFLVSTICNISDEIFLNQGWDGNTFFRGEGEFVILIGLEVRDDHLFPEKIRELCRQLKDNLSLFVNLSASFGLSLRNGGFPDLKNLYREAAAATELRLYNGRGSINFYREDLKSEGSFFDGAREEELRGMLQNGLICQAQIHIEGILDRILAAGNIIPARVHRECSEILHTFSSVIKQYGGKIDEIRDEQGNDPFKSITDCDTLEDIKIWFKIFVEKYAGYINESKTRRYGREVARALEFINLHYIEDLKLSDLAAYIGMNETYFSHLFKKETGANFTDYVNSLRINKAKDYLRAGDYSIYQVAEKVGYANVSYFSKVFKQLVGMSPLEFKKSIG